MIEILWGIILMPFAACAVVFTGALGVVLIKEAYKAIFNRKK
jgi:hypothetical protein